jgi:hypothetical protein
MCRTCFRIWLLHLRHLTPHEVWQVTDLTRVLDRIRPFVERGTLKIIQGEADFQNLSQNPGADAAFLTAFVCVHCDREYQLSVCKGNFQMR